MTLEAAYKWPFQTQVKVFYVPFYEYDKFHDSDDYKYWLAGDDFGKTFHLWKEDTCEANTRYVCSKTISLNFQNLLYNQQFNFPENTETDATRSYVEYRTRWCPFFFALLDVSGGCNWV